VLAGFWGVVFVCLGVAFFYSATREEAFAHVAMGLFAMGVGAYLVWLVWLALKPFSARLVRHVSAVYAYFLAVELGECLEPMAERLPEEQILPQGALETLPVIAVLVVGYYGLRVLLVKLTRPDADPPRNGGPCDSAALSRPNHDQGDV
jgi:hypothetical protein